MIRTNWVWLCVLWGLLGLVGCSQRLGESQLPRPSTRLASDTAQFPGIVQVLGQQLCTGALVGSQTVLTAAHCVAQSNSLSVKTSQAVYPVSEKLILGAGVEGDPHDLALLYLSRPLAASETLMPLAAGVSRGDSVVVIGYGCADSNAMGTSGVKRLGTNVISDVNEFIELSTPGIRIRAVAGPENRAGVCFGDSGGPLLKQVGNQWMIVGVAHGAYNESSGQISQFVDLNLPENRAFLSQHVK